MTECDALERALGARQRNRLGQLRKLQGPQLIKRALAAHCQGRTT